MTSARKVSLLSSMSIYGVSNGLSALVPFLLLPFLTRYLSPQEFGLVTMFLLVVNISTILAGVNMNGSISVAYFKNESREMPSFVSSGMSVILISLLLCLAISSAFKNFLSELFEVNYRYIVLAVLVGGCQAIYLVYLSLLQASDRPFSFLKVKLFQSLSDMLFTLILVATLSYGFQGRVSAYSIALFGCFVITIICLLRNKLLVSGIKKKHVKRILQFGLPLMPHVLAGSMIMYIDRFYITNLVSSYATGLYMAAFQVSMVVLLAAETINKAYAPWLFGILSGKSQHSRSRAVLLSYLFFTLIVFTYVILLSANQLLFKYFVGENFSAAVNLVPYLGAGFVFQGMYYIVTNYVFYAEKTKQLSTVSMVVTILGAGLSWFLIDLRGLEGGAISFMITNLVLFLSTWLLAARYIKMPWFKFYKEAAEF